MVNRFTPPRTPDQQQPVYSDHPNCGPDGLGSSRPFHRTKLLVVVAASLVMFGAAIPVMWIFLQNPTAPVTAELEKSAGFPLLAPSPMPAGVTYKSGSTRFSHGIVTYLLHDSYGIISVSEQIEPSAPPDLSRDPNLKLLSVAAGQADVGLNDGRPVGIIISNHTFVTIFGASEVPLDVISRIATSLASLPN